MFRTTMAACVAACAMLGAAGSADAAIMMATFEGAVTGTGDRALDVSGAFGAPGANLNSLAYRATYTYDTSKGFLDTRGPRLSWPQGVVATIMINGITWTQQGYEYGFLGFTPAGLDGRPRDAFEIDVPLPGEHPEVPGNEIGTRVGFLTIRPMPFDLDAPFKITDGLYDTEFRMTYKDDGTGPNAAGEFFVFGNIETVEVTCLDGCAVAVPEPSTWALLIGGFGVAGAALRRRRLTFTY